MRPSSPCATSSFTNRYSRVKTVVSIMQYFLPDCFCASTTRRHSSMVRAIGTVHATCLPALSASMLIQACSSMGELICTASTFGSAINSAKSV